MSNRFFTILIIPEKTSTVRRIVIPGWLVRAAVIGSVFTVALAGIMVLDYWYVMGRIGENKQLKVENRRLRQQVQVLRNKMTTIEATVDRIKTFATRLKVITNIEDRDGMLENLNNGKLPDAASNVGAGLFSPESAVGIAAKSPDSTTDSDTGGPRPTIAPTIASTQAAPPESSPSSFSAPQAKGLPPPETTTAASAASPATTDPSLSSASRSWFLSDEPPLHREYQELDRQFSLLGTESLLIEQILQDQYELLADQKAFLAALPTRKPALGYFTSGFGIRKSPTGGRIKMHEGLDVANHPGTPIRATADGVVVFSAIKAGYGQTLIIDHGYGLETWYAHNRRLLVGRGEKVRRGDVIAQLGNSGRSTGPHLHYEVRVNGTPVDPLSYILEN
jgi:murein DD-endopeptidase MepM/ murein hydrolase activator NlpD